MSKRGPLAPYVSTEEELRELVSAVQTAGAFSFDVETRGNIHHHPDVMELIEAEWQEKKASLKSENSNVIARSRQSIEDRWTSELALDTFRNEVFWISVATEGRSWAIPMGHPNGEVLVKEVRGDGTTIPPPGHRALLANGTESKRKAKFFIPAVFSPAPEQLTKEQVFTILEPLFMDEHIVKINQNIKFDAKSIAKYYGGNLPKGTYVDTQVLMHIANENLMMYNLTSILDAVFGFDPYAERGGKIGSTIVHEPFSKACRYVHYDARWTWLTYKRLWRMIAAVPSLYQALMIDVPNIRVVAQMEMNGIHVNRREMVRLGKELDVKLNEVKRDLYPHTFLGFNPDSNADKSKLLFGPRKEGGLGFKPIKVSKKTGKPSVDADVLEKYRGQHPAVDILLDYAEVKKMKSTYVDGMVPLLHNVSFSKHVGLVHPQFHFHRTATGRFSSSDPNLQNIPRDGRMRSLFVAHPHDSLVVADYSQIEMRIMAMFSQDPELLNIFANDIDVHTGTATVILGRPPADSEERNIYGKVPNFLMGYGGQAKRLVEATNGAITLKEAERIVDGYNQGYAGLTKWKDRILADGRRKGYVETLYGRRRRLPDLTADLNTKDGWAARTRAERQAINAVVQGTAAEICKKAMVKLDSALDWPKCKMLVQVHDEIVTSVPTEEIGIWIPVIEQAMGNGTILHDGKVKEGVKLEVEAHAAGSWDKAKG
jgi:DNA polymerase-1